MKGAALELRVCAAGVETPPRVKVKFYLWLQPSNDHLDETAPAAVAVVAAGQTVSDSAICLPRRRLCTAVCLFVGRLFRSVFPSYFETVFGQAF